MRSGKRPLKIYPFRAVVDQGTLWRNVIDNITAKKTAMLLAPEGISIVQVNAGTVDPRVREVLVDINLPSERFTTYICPRAITISMDTREHQKILKNMKKKNKIEVYLKPKAGFFLFCIKIFQNEKSFDGYSLRCSEAKTPMAPHPEEGAGIYRKHVSLGSAEFGKLKNLASTVDAKKLKITTQVCTNFIRFDAMSAVNPAKKVFGELIKDVPSFTADKDGWIWCKKCDGFIDSVKSKGCCRCMCEVCARKRWDCECVCPCGTGEFLAECPCLAEPFEIITQDYPSSALYKLTKLSSLQVPMRFYEPKTPDYPLKIEFEAAYRSNTLGTIKLYIWNYREVQDRLKKILSKSEASTREKTRASRKK